MSSAQTGFSTLPPAGMPGDMGFVGTFSIIYGGFVCLSIIGALIGIPLIIAGLRLKDAADAYAAMPSGDPNALQRAFTGQASYFRILKILMIIALVLIACEILLVIAFVGSIPFLHRANSF